MNFVVQQFLLTYILVMLLSNLNNLQTYTYKAKHNNKGPFKLSNKPTNKPIS